MPRRAIGGEGRDRAWRPGTSPAGHRWPHGADEQLTTLPTRSTSSVDRSAGTGLVGPRAQKASRVPPPGRDEHPESARDRISDSPPQSRDPGPTREVKCDPAPPEQAPVARDLRGDSSLEMGAAGPTTPDSHRPGIGPSLGENNARGESTLRPALRLHRV